MDGARCRRAHAPDGGAPALVDRDSRVRAAGIVFHDTLYDENAGSHIAWGQSFPYALAGGLELALGANYLASLLALLTLASYLLAYTPLKRKTPLCTLVGAFPGAMPPLIGWAAAQGRLSAEAWVLYALLFFWQFPHFLGIAWLYREDYERAGLRMLPAGDQGARAMAWQVVAASFALLLVSLAPVYFGRFGAIYLAGAVFAGLVFGYYGAWTALVRSKPVARRLVLASVIYLPMVLGLMVANKIWF